MCRSDAKIGKKNSMAHVRKKQNLRKRESFTKRKFMEQRIIISENLEEELALAISECEHDRLFVLTDSTTRAMCLPKISKYRCLRDAKIIEIAPTDTHKDIDTLAHVWSELGNGGATRHSCMINLGGGMVTDLGGFAASTFKRGIDFINIPTTLLAMVDASVGGKTGINFNGLKNEIGVFNDSRFVILCTKFLDTLDHDNVCSGYGEMLKHALISNREMWAEHVNFDLDHPDLKQLQDMVARSVAVKERVVTEDPYEKGLRKALNLGHTIGHAFEAWALHRQTPVLHGFAVAYGLACELYLSAAKVGFPTDVMRATVQFINQYYPKLSYTCDDYEEFYRLMLHDKKNVAGVINFTLLDGIGSIKINQTATKDEIFEALDFYREN